MYVYIILHFVCLVLLGSLDGGGGGNGGKGPDSPNDSSAVTSPAGISLSSPLNLASVSSPGPLSIFAEE
jgi:hypothetical protein